MASTVTTIIAPAGHAPAIGVTLNVAPPSALSISTATAAPLAVAVMWPGGVVGSAKFVNETVTAGSIAGSAGAVTLAENGAIVNTSCPACSRPLPVNGVVPSLARTICASRLTVTVAPDGNSGWGAEYRLGPFARKLPKNAGPKMLKMRPSRAPVDE